MKANEKKSIIRPARVPVHFLVFLVLMAGVVRAGQSPLDIHQTAEKEISERQKMQQHEEQWTERKQSLKRRYQELESQIQTMKTRKDRLSDKLDLRRQKVNGMEQTIVESDRVKKELQSTLESIAARLDRFVENDLPFLEDERSQRIKALKACLIDPDVPLAEKTRRTFEALQVELDYGRRLETSEETVDIDNREMAVDVLRVGRLSLFCRTADGSTTGRYVPAQKNWQLLGEKYDSAISEAMEVAAQRSPVKMINLPLGRLEVE